MDTQAFINDLAEAVRGYKNANVFAKTAGINSTFLYRLLRGERFPSLKMAAALWPFVYGSEFPEIARRPGADSPAPEKAAE